MTAGGKEGEGKVRGCGGGSGGQVLKGRIEAKGGSGGSWGIL